MTANDYKRSLDGKLAIVTGGGGEIGQVIAQRYLEEGAIVIITGRSETKLQAAVQNLITKQPSYSDKIHWVVMDNAESDSVSKSLKKIYEQFGSIDVLINNAGSAGPKQLIKDLPFSKDQLKQDNETVAMAIGSLLLGPWLVAKEAKEYLAENASIINVSTIFAYTEYFGRAAYVVPKAALNALSKQLAQEFGKDKRNIRVNTVYPGPVAGDRIAKVFAAMDKLQHLKDGDTSNHYLNSMLLRNADYVKNIEVADTIVFLGSNASSGLTAQNIEVTHGMDIHTNTTCDLLSVPHIDAPSTQNSLIWVIATQPSSDLEQFIDIYRHTKTSILVTVARDIDAEQLSKQYKQFANIKIYSFDANTEPSEDLISITAKYNVTGVVIFPVSDLHEYPITALDGANEKIAEFVIKSLTYYLAIAKFIENQNDLNRSRIIIFSQTEYSNTCLAKILSTAITELIMVWRKERSMNLTNGRQIYQLIRYCCPTNNASLTYGILTWLLSVDGDLPFIDFKLTKNTQNSEFNFPMFEPYLQSIRNLHHDKVALITGGSAGIGSEIARLLVLSGAKIAVAARDEFKLIKLYEKLTSLLRNYNVSDPEKRILIIGNADIGDVETAKRITDATLQAFGRIDYLINNASIPGEEKMLVDMSLAGWRHTLRANLLSTYELILLVEPKMRAQKYGYIINLSSHFGGIRNTTVVYPNRADYALTKTGQRILAENYAAYLGPYIQINAVAPGPVEGARIRGDAMNSGLYQNRAQLILENKRVQKVYEGLLSLAAKYNHIELIALLAKNKIADIKEQLLFSDILQAVDCSDADALASEYLFDRKLFDRLIRRLKIAMFLPVNFDQQQMHIDFVAPDAEPKSTFFSAKQIQDGVKKIHNKMINALALRHMPTEVDVARDVVYYLSNHNVTGETLYPSCGLKFDNFVTESKWIAQANSVQQLKLNDLTVYIFGNSAFVEMADLALSYLQGNASKVIVILANNEGLTSFNAALDKNMMSTNVDISRLASTTFHTNSVTEALDGMISLINNLTIQYGAPDVIISLPLTDLKAQIHDYLPDVRTLEDILDAHVTNNFALAQSVCLKEGCKMIIVTQSLSGINKNHTILLEFANFISCMLRTMTATVAKETEVLGTNAFFYQVEPDDNDVTEVILDLSAIDTSETRYKSGMIIKA